jgi:23S rRNA (adenine2503-C2)-methyltransferase
MDLTALREALVEYSGRTGRRPSLEYALIAGVNDTHTELMALKAFCEGMLVHVNLIPVNAVSQTPYRRSGTETAEQFVHTLAASGTEATVRAERGGDIDAACGQLRQRSRS